MLKKTQKNYQNLRRIEIKTFQSWMDGKNWFFPHMHTKMQGQLPI
jgi:hypothetical protein